MDQSTLAGYAYHNCEFERAIRLVLEGSPSEDAAQVHVKALAELDEKEAGLKWATTYAAAFPRSGTLRYLVGMASYLAGRDSDVVETAFRDALALGYAGGSMGLAFSAFAEGDYQRATRLLVDAQGLASEMEHVRRLMLVQVHVTGGRLDLAEGELSAADRALARQPSLLRQLWGQLCWVRLWRAKGSFEAAGAVLTRVLAQVTPDGMPRLHRNATEAMKMVAGRSAAANIILPPRAVPPPKEVSRKPMLSSLYAFLQSVGPKGASKESIVEHVWEESYNPMIHDDRIYKAVGRLRKLLGDDQASPRLLVQMGRNYVLTPPDAPETNGESA